ncbi:MAG TPA: hypothetical protein VMT81_02500 [Candidatus Paceibacterota bacterium]|nr:hypothetical protein [Candidatus Paceibacterota bacterium]
MLNTARWTALTSGAILGFTAEFIVPFAYLHYHKTMPFRLYCLGIVIAIGAAIVVAILFAAMAAARLWSRTKFPYDMVVDGNNHFQPCPRCGGEIEQKLFGGWTMPMAADPTCRECKTRYHLHEKWLFGDEFEVLPAE